jgi:hypothetical protein
MADRLCLFDESFSDGAARDQRGQASNCAPDKPARPCT